MTEYIMDRQYDVANGTFSNVKREEIVRCRDCKYYDRYPNDYVCVCYRFDNEQPIVEPDGFCAWALRKEVDE